MVYIEKGLRKYSSTNNADVVCNIKKKRVPQNWGDEENPKYVSDMLEGEIIISGEMAEKCKDISTVNWVRYNYFDPCYRICGSISKTVRDDGTIIFTITE